MGFSRRAFFGLVGAAIPAVIYHRLFGNTRAWLTLRGWADAQNKNLEQVAELLSETNAVLDDMEWIEGDHTFRTTIPADAWRLACAGQGIPTTLKVQHG